MTAGYGNHEPQRNEPGTTPKPGQQGSTAKPGSANENKGQGGGSEAGSNDVATPGAGTLPSGNQGNDADAASS